MIVAEGAINANRHRDPRKQRADPLGSVVRPGQTRGRGVASSLIATADVGAVGLCSGANPPGSWGTRHRCRPSCQARGGTKTPAWEPVERGNVVALVARVWQAPLPCPAGAGSPTIKGGRIAHWTDFSSGYRTVCRSFHCRGPGPGSEITTGTLEPAVDSTAAFLTVSAAMAGLWATPPPEPCPPDCPDCLLH